MPEVYSLLARRSDELLAREALPSTLPTSWVLDLPRATIYLALIMVARWAWHLVALERSRIAPEKRSGAFLILTALFPMLVVALAFLLNPDLMDISMAWFWCAGLILSTLSGSIRAFWGLPRTSDRPPEPPVVWHDWLSAVIISVVACATLVQLLVIGVALSLVLGSVVFISVLLGEETGAVPTVAEAITTLISMQQITVIVGAAVPLLLLPLFLLYVWIRGKRENPAPAPSPS